VIDYDMQHHSDFLQTLKLYIEYGSNVQRVAEEACMHRNTVNYRVRRMKEMLNNPMEYMSQTFSLQMAFYIMDLYPDLEPR
jgi:DNA-binding PucR family transcriptional regulator